MASASSSTIHVPLSAYSLPLTCQSPFLPLSPRIRSSSRARTVPISIRCSSQEDALDVTSASAHAEVLHRHNEFMKAGRNGVSAMVALLNEDGYTANSAALALVTSLDKRGRNSLLSALFSSSSASSDHYFDAADVNKDGVLDRQEFQNFVEAQTQQWGLARSPLTRGQILQLATRSAIGMVGFGFTDNAIMIVAGDLIQNSIGCSLGLSTLMSAGLGNAVSDLLGTALREYIESISSRFLPEADISPPQMAFKEARWAETVGSSVGVTCGCLLGLTPLFFIGLGTDTPSPPASVLKGRTEQQSSVYNEPAEIHTTMVSLRSSSSSIGQSSSGPSSTSSSFQRVDTPVAAMAVQAFHPHGRLSSAHSGFAAPQGSWMLSASLSLFLLGKWIGRIFQSRKRKQNSF
eukprot:TRINITY_DN5936_c0_g1_i2.p1 TRINITY_DN5936_c0_g1~~TRINITY_DN5936_c0_g1_i2.p1  ORF type:complete len:405 (-),score=75.18 TRINITY_DN5936_c0_g1_i2:110-1324(-)